MIHDCIKIEVYKGTSKWFCQCGYESEGFNHMKLLVADALEHGWEEAIEWADSGA